MSVTLLLITHDDIGSSLLDAAVTMMGISPMAYINLKITAQMDINFARLSAHRNFERSVPHPDFNILKYIEMMRKLIQLIICCMKTNWQSMDITTMR